MDMVPLTDAVMHTLSEYYAKADDPGMITSFVLVTEVVRASGDGTVSVAHPETQSYTQTLGLIGFGEEWIRDDMRTSFLQLGTEE